MKRISIIGTSARDKAIAGAEYLINALSPTLGPFGSDALLKKDKKVTNDGYTISKAIVPTIKDEFERSGAELMHEASAKTNEEVGDATTSSPLLTFAVIKEAIKYLPRNGVIVGKKKPIEVIKQIEQEKNKVLEILKKDIKEIKTEEELIKSAKVSVEYDDLAELIGKAQWKLGKEGIIISEEVNERDCSIEFVKGIKFDNGFGTSYIVTNPEKQQSEIEDFKVLLTTHTIEGLKQILPLLQEINNQGGKRRLAIVARAFTPEAIRECIEYINSGFNIYPLNAPFTNMKEIMKDLASVLDAKLIDVEERRLEDITLSDLGNAKKIVAKRYEAIITGEENQVTKVNVKNRLDELKKELKGEPSEFNKKELQKRIAQLNNGFAILKVGAMTDTERKKKKDKCDDAVLATRLAFQGGTVKGAGLAFKEASEKLPTDSILKNPLNIIYNTLMNNAPEGFVIEDWVRDPYLVLESALTNACNIGSIFANLNVIEAEANPKICSCNSKNIEE